MRPHFSRLRRLAVAVPVLLAAATLRAQPLPQLTSISIDSASFVAGRGGRVGIAVSPLPDAGNGRAAQLRIRLDRSGVEGPAIFEGSVTDRPTWDGLLGGSVVTSGRYDLVAEVRLGSAVERIRRPVTITVTPIETAASVVLPTVDTLLVRDLSAEDGAVRRAVTTTTAGLGLALLSSSLVGPAIEASAPDGAPRLAVAAGYISGLAIALWGMKQLVQRVGLRVERPMAVPVESNLRLNQASVGRTGVARVEMRFDDEGRP